MTTTARTRNVTNTGDQRFGFAKTGGEIHVAPLGGRSVALHGAALAFSAPPATPRSMPNTYSGTNGALAAAMTAGVSNQTMASSRSFSNGGSIAHGTFSAGAHQESAPRDETQGFYNGSASTILRVPDDKQSSRSRSPSNIAAKLAAAKYTPLSQRVSPNAARRPNRQRSRGEEPVQNPGTQTNTTSIPSTNTLVSLFERKSSSQPTEYSVSSAKTRTVPAIQSPMPVRPLSNRSVPLGGAVLPKARSPVEFDRAWKAHLTTDGFPVQQAGVDAVPVQGFSSSSRASETSTSSALINSRLLRRSSSIRSSTSIMRDIHNRPNHASGDKPSIESYASAFERAQRPPLPPPRRSTRRKFTGHSESSGTGVEQSTQSTTDVDQSAQLDRPYPRSPPELPLASWLPLERSHGQKDPEKRRRAALKPVSPHLTEDSLANAIVASSLASSRAPSPTKPNAPPLPTRHAKPQIFRHHNRQQQDLLDSRTPSPAKGMRHTMRRPARLDDDNDSGSGAYRQGRKNPLKKHPNKHHEGDRKRWRDEVTERERKRYEGVWAANKGLYISDSDTDDTSNQPPAIDAVKSMVLNVVVRDIWSRSRLSDNVLEEVWDLVDNRAIGMLAREEFVVGMWLIDQRLKGRKLPVKVSDSVWASVRRLSGIKFSKNR
ncbi:MAG: Increased rDNA silencing protein [Pleopsidium flavum]|nr:MAG: Increased rDNA silencing protein [Pleopsidium flavum]